MSEHTAFYDTECEVCGSPILEGDGIWFSDDGKLCEDCADEQEVRCPECGGQKKPDYDMCYECHNQE